MPPAQDYPAINQFRTLLFGEPTFGSLTSQPAAVQHSYLLPKVCF